MRIIHFILLVSTAFLAACSGKQPVEKAILGTWVQDTPISMTSDGIQSTTSDTVLRIQKNGAVHLTRNIDIRGQGLPVEGVGVSLELRGKWEILSNQLKQTQETALIMPRSSDATARELAEQLQVQADQSPPTLKDIISVDKKQLILQDQDTGTTDIYRRK